MNLTHDFVAQALDLSPGTPATFTSVTTDSRKVAPGCLFVALKGDKFDGHDFIETAVTHGAAGIILRKDHPAPELSGVAFYRVSDTLHAFRALGGAWRRAHTLPVVAVAGSVGKTTTKEILTALLRGRWPEVLKTAGSQNGFIGIPITLLELKECHGAAVIEVGIDDIGAMEKHIPLVKPTASMITKIGAEHLEQLKDLPTVAREESLALTMVARDGGQVAFNLDDPWLKPLKSALPPEQVVAYTMNPNEALNPTFKTILGSASVDGKTLTVMDPDVGTIQMELPLPGAHNARNLLAATTMARILNLSAQEILAGLKTFRGAEGRSEVRLLAGPTPVVCDYYNANPDSMSAGLSLLREVADNKNSLSTWCCLGDMLELGPEELRFHKELAKPLCDLGLNQILLLGPRMRSLYEELQGLKQSKAFKGEVRHFASHGDLARELVKNAKPKDAILIKGSRSMRMEEVWKVLQSHAQAHWP